ncbi:PAS domain S-box protein [Ensifer adhaerens]|nr:PAS domain S-box protein [Ensifer adhaerens]MDF8357583.1 PAS domain S-box protein [Ensifer adhaerens]
MPSDRLEEEPAILARIQTGERVDHFETVRRRKDGALIDISLTISPIRNSRGEIIGASKVARDISERRRIAEHRELLLREMHHRVKNLFAVFSLPWICSFLQQAGKVGCIAGDHCDH